MGLSKSKAKGTRIENELKDKHLALDIPCERVPLSGSIGGKYSGDLVIGSIENVIFRCESKARKDGQGFTTLEKWMGENDIMFLRRDRAQPLVVLPWRVYELFIKAYYDTIK